MYQGEVHIGQEQLKEFLKAAQLLQVRGLTDVPAPGPITTIDQKASPVSFNMIGGTMLGAKIILVPRCATFKCPTWYNFNNVVL